MRLLTAPKDGNFRYYMAYDLYCSDREGSGLTRDEEVIYGLYKVDFTRCHYAAVEFHNEISAIDLLMREVTQSEWETYVAFELFPVLHAYDSSTFYDVRQPYTLLATTFKVRFRDY